MEKVPEEKKEESVKPAAPEFGLDDGETGEDLSEVEAEDAAAAEDEADEDEEQSGENAPASDEGVKEGGDDAADVQQSDAPPSFKTPEEEAAYWKGSAEQKDKSYKDARARMNEAVRRENEAAARLLEKTPAPGAAETTGQPTPAEAIAARAQEIQREEGLDKEQAEVLARREVKVLSEVEAKNEKLREEGREEAYKAERAKTANADYATVKAMKDFSKYEAVMTELANNDEDVQHDLRLVRKPASYLLNLAKLRLQGKDLEAAKGQGRKEALTKKEASESSASVRVPGTGKDGAEGEGKRHNLFENLKEMGIEVKTKPNKPGEGLDEFTQISR